MRYCLNCNKELIKPQKKFCSHSCSQKYHWNCKEWAQKTIAAGNTFEVIKKKRAGSKKLWEDAVKKKQILLKRKQTNSLEEIKLNRSEKLKNRWKSDNPPLVRKEKISKVCIICGNTFIPKNIKNKNNYCSHTCMGKDLKRIRPLKHKQPIIKNCPICKKDFISPHKNTTFCSRKCGAKSLKHHNIRGNNNPSWKGGVSNKYDFRFNKEQKIEILDRDNYTCQLCGNIKDLCIHHIDYDKKHSYPTNLIALCKSCHAIVNFNRNYWIEYLKIYMKQSGKIKNLTLNFITKEY